MKVGRSPADVEKHTGSNDANARPIKHGALEAEVYHLRSRPHSAGKIAPEFAYALLVNQIVEVRPANDFKHRIGTAHQFSCKRIGDDFRLREAMAKQVGKMPIACEKQRSISVTPGLASFQPLLQGS